MTNTHDGKSAFSKYSHLTGKALQTAQQISKNIPKMVDIRKSLNSNSNFVTCLTTITYVIFAEKRQRG